MRLELYNVKREIDYMYISVALIIAFYAKFQITNHSVQTLNSSIFFLLMDMSQVCKKVVFRGLVPVGRIFIKVFT